MKRYTIVFFILLLAGCGNHSDSQKQSVIEKGEVESIVDEWSEFDKNNLMTVGSELFCDDCEEKATLCDSTLQSEIIRNELIDVRSCGQDANIADIYPQRKKNCLSLSKETNGFKVSNETEQDLLLAIQDCSKRYKSFECAYRFVAFKAGAIKSVVADISSKMIVLPASLPTSCAQRFLQTEGRRRVNGKITKPSFYLKPLESPFASTKRITQCYFGTYSHQNLYALDFGANVGTAVRSVKPGIVVLKLSGSNVRCDSSYDATGDRYWTVFKGSKRVNLAMKECPSCVFYDYPSICNTFSSANTVFVWHPDNTFSKYVHLTSSNENVEFGDVVNLGQTVGEIGLTGWTTGGHLHFEALELQLSGNSHRFNSIPTYFSTADGQQYPCQDTLTMEPL